MNRDYGAGCSTRKHAYPSHARALTCARMQLGKRRVLLNVYRCNECGRWHISGTRMPRRIEDVKH